MSDALPESGLVDAQITMTDDVPPGTKRCFIVCPIGKDGSDERKRSDKIKRHIIDKALRPLGYETVRADLVDKSGSITTQIVSDLISADLVIADLTGHNPNVFYELAIRHAFAKPYIQLIEEGEVIPFDVSAYRTVMVDHRDLDSAEKALETIQNMVRDIEDGDPVESPVVHAVNRQALGQSSNPEKQELAQLGESMDELRREIRLIGARDRHMMTIPPPTRSEYSAMTKALSQISEASGLPYDVLKALRSAEGVSKKFSSWAHLLKEDDEPPF